MERLILNLALIATSAAQRYLTPETQLQVFMGAWVIEQLEVKRSNPLIRKGSVSKVNDW